MIAITNDLYSWLVVVVVIVWPLSFVCVSLWRLSSGAAAKKVCVPLRLLVAGWPQLNVQY